MAWLILGLIVFLGGHSISIVVDDWRNRMVARMGAAAWRGAYSLVAAAGVALIAYGYAAARSEPVFLYFPPLWMRHSAMLLMMFVFPLLIAAYLPGRINTAFKHPMLVGVKTWAFSHLLANGALADVVLFGAFLIWAVADRISVNRRPLRPVPAAPPSPLNDLIAIVGGLVVYGTFFLGVHRWLTGMPLVL